MMFMLSVEFRVMATSEGSALISAASFSWASCGAG